MPLKLLLLPLCIFLHFTLYSQNVYDTKLIKPELIENAYVVTRMHEVNVQIPSIDKMNIKRKVALTILNRKGSYAASVDMYYRDGAEKIKSFKISIYDSKGKLVKKVKKKEVSDQSVYDGSMATDQRVLFYESAYSQYPYTIEYEYEEESSSTSSIPTWSPYLNFFSSVEQSNYTIHANPDFQYTYKLKNIEDFSTEFNLESAPKRFSVENLKAIQSEELAPENGEFLPRIMFSPFKSKWGKTEVSFENWESLGTWMYDAYLIDKSNLSEAAKKEVTTLASAYGTDFDKAKAIYEYATSSTRYVSIQLGEGGLEPFYAQDVHEKKYGDCKALSMYTMSLMKAVNLHPFYVVIESGYQHASNFETDYASLEQGDHIIIGIPIGNDTIFADCTTSTSPFGYYSSFTDGRLALAVTEEGGSIVRTHRYEDEENSSVLETDVKINPTNNIVELSIKNSLAGERISSRMGIDDYSESDIAEKIYPDAYPSFAKEDFINIKGQLTSHHSYEESFGVNCQGLLSTAGDYLLLPIHYYPILLEKLNDKDRKLPIYIKHGFSKTYNYSIAIPKGYELGELLEPLKIESVFGEYELRSMSEQEGEIMYTIQMLYKSGTYNREKAVEYNNWIEEIQNIENKNILLKPSK